MVAETLMLVGDSRKQRARQPVIYLQYLENASIVSGLEAIRIRCARAGAVIRVLLESL